MNAQTGPRTSTDHAVPAVVVAGIHGYGGQHLQTVLSLAEQGRARLAALVDPRGGTVRRQGSPDVPAESLAPLFPDLDSALDGVEADVVVIATPLQTHYPLTLAALGRGADVLLEKPPVTLVQDFQALVDAADRAGRLVQVGFQSLGSQAVDAVRQAVQEGVLGRLQQVSALGCWRREQAYWQRSSWAGRRRMDDGAWVVDGAVTNPFAHATATALSVVGATGGDDVAGVEVDLYHCNPIEMDDTSSVRIWTTSGLTVMAAFTLAAQSNDPPVVTLHGDRGSLDLYYTEDRVVGRGSAERLSGSYSRTGLVENLLAARQGSAQLLVPLASTGAFMRVMDAVGRADVRDVPTGLVTWHGEGAGRHPLVADVQDTLGRVAREGRLLAELGLGWGGDRSASTDRS